MCVDVNNHLKTTVSITPLTEQQLPVRIKQEVIEDEDSVGFLEESTFEEIVETFTIGDLVEDSHFSPVVLLEPLDPKYLEKLNKSPTRMSASINTSKIKCPVCHLTQADQAVFINHLKKHYSQDVSIYIPSN